MVKTESENKTLPGLLRSDVLNNLQSYFVKCVCVCGSEKEKKNVRDNDALKCLNS